MTVWDQVLARVETKVNRHSFSTWFRRTEFVSDDGQRVTIRVPDTVFRDWLLKHYSGVLADALAEVSLRSTSRSARRAGPRTGLARPRARVRQIAERRCGWARQAAPAGGRPRASGPVDPAGDDAARIAPDGPGSIARHGSARGWARR